MDMFGTSFLRFHVAFTMRRVLYELGAPLQGNTAFNQIKQFNKVAWERLKNELGFKNPDCRNKEGANHGLGEIYLWYANGPDIEAQGRHTKINGWNFRYRRKNRPRNQHLLHQEPNENALGSFYPSQRHRPNKN